MLADAFFDALQRNDLMQYKGGIVPRNSNYSDWWTYFDIRVEQEFPAFAEGHKFAGWITVKNFCNLLNSEWCVLRQVSFPRRQAIVDMEISPDGQYYIYEDYIEPSGQGRREGSRVPRPFGASRP